MDNLLQKQLQEIPHNPGIYEFFNSKSGLLYVGKAKNLRHRVKSYFHTKASLSPAKQIMVSQIHHLQTTIVKNETEALLLEGSLIKQHQPLYNIVLKDDKSWLYFAIDYRDQFPRVSLERQFSNKKIKYFGPYPSANSARESFKILKKILGLKTCSNRPEKPCFESKLGRCWGHKLDKNSLTYYQQQLSKLEKILRGDTKDLLHELKHSMAQASQNHHYELAGRLRDQIKSLEKLIIKQNILSAKPENYDVFNLARSGDITVICRLPVRHGSLLDAEKMWLEQTKDLSDQDVLEDFLNQYYPQVADKVKQAFVPLTLTDKKIINIKLTTPHRGKKASLLRMAKAIAYNYLTQSATSWQKKETRAKLDLEELKNVLHLHQLPERIEGYDISNIQGKEAVGAMVVLTNGLLDNKQYRKFKIQGFTKPNDFAMLAQMLVRRFTNNHDWPKPNLIMLDGGAGQLSVVKHELDQYKINIPIIALAKQEELIYLPKQKLPLRLKNNSSALLLLQQLRDEAHRFGITFHRSLHKKSATKSIWDTLPGIGPKLKKKLKTTFGSWTKIQQASIEDITKIVGPHKAKLIKDYIKSNY